MRPVALLPLPLVITFLLLLFHCPFTRLSAAPPQLRISEFAAAGNQGVPDEDGDSPDWIEIENTSPDPVDLAGWTLDVPSKRSGPWTFPSLSLAPATRLVILASGKNRRLPGQPLHTHFKLSPDGGTLVLRSPSGDESRVDSYPTQLPGITFGIPDHSAAAEASSEDLPHLLLIGPESPIRFLPSAAYRSAMDWIHPDFNDVTWIRGRNGIGFSARIPGLRDLLQLDLRPSMLGRPGGLFLRFPFQVPHPLPSQLRIHAHFDDGFVAWINGQPIAHRFAPQELHWDSRATHTRNDEEARIPERILLPNAQRFLRPGVNVLAIHLLNASQESSDLLFRIQVDAPVPPTQPALPNAIESSTPRFAYLNQPTPGQPNAPAVWLGPPIDRLQHHPSSSPIPTHSDLIVTARVSPSSSPVTSVRLHLRVMSHPESSIEMLDDGLQDDGTADNGVYGARIPPSLAAQGQLVRYWVTATDAAQASSRWPLLPRRRGYSAFHGFVVADPNLASTRLPVLSAFPVDSPALTHQGLPTRLALVWRGEFYDNVEASEHGQYSRSFPKPSYNIDFPLDHPFRVQPDLPRVKSIKLLSNFADKSKLRNTLAYDAIQASGSLGHFAFPVRVQLNGRFHSVAEIVEHGDGLWLERLGRDPDGALYKMYGNLAHPGGAEKKTRKFEDHSDLAQLVAGIQPRRPIEQRAAFAYDHLDLPQCISYLVAMALISSDDHGHKNYYLYRDSRRSGEWALLPWDVDLSWGRNWTGQYFNETLFGDNPINLYRDGRSKARNPLYDLLFQYPDFRQMYLRRLRTVMDQLLQPPETPADQRLLDQRILAWIDRLDPPDISPSDADLDNQAWPSWGVPRSMREEARRILDDHLPARRRFLFQSSRARLFNDPIPPSQPPHLDLRLTLPPDSTPAPTLYVILTNPHQFAVDLSLWRLRGCGIQHTLRPGTVLPPGASLAVVAQARAFRHSPPREAAEKTRFVQGDWNGAWNPQAGPIQLLDPSGQLSAVSTQ